MGTVPETAQASGQACGGVRFVITPPPPWKWDALPRVGIGL